MKVKTSILSLCLLLTGLTLQPSLQAAIVITNGRIQDADSVATMPVQEHFSLGVAAFNQKNWDESAIQFNIVIANFPNTAFAVDSYYYLGVSYYYLEEFDFANEELSNYLKAQHNPKFFEQSIEYKFAIAENFKNGARRRLFGTKQLPKWGSGQAMALDIYDEVIAALPCHDLAAKALYAKGNLQWELLEFRECIESFQMLIRRFPKNELTPECYLAITEVYLQQCKCEFQNPDLLALAQINLRKFEQDFPREERLEEANSNVEEIKEVYARGLYETGQFYERTKKPHASILYYRNAVNKFPDTDVAEMCKERLTALKQS